MKEVNTFKNQRMNTFSFIIKGMAFDDKTKDVTTPGITPTEGMYTEAEDKELSPRDATRYKAIVARAIYLSKIEWTCSSRRRN